MKTYYKIIQINSRVEIQDFKTQSVYEHDLYIQLDAVGYSSKTDALSALSQFLNTYPDDRGEYTILELYSN